MLTKLKPKSEFSKNVLTLMTGTTIAQAIPIAAMPILTRIYSPEDFGLLAIFVAISTIFGSIANGRYELAILLPEKDEDAINIAALGLLIAVFLSLLLFLVVFAFNESIVQLLNSPEISDWLFLVPVVVLMIGLFNILNYLNTRKKQFKDIAKGNVYRAIAQSAIQVLVGLLKNGISGLVLGSIVGYAVLNIRLFLTGSKNYSVGNIELSRIKGVAKRYIGFPKFSMWAILANTISFNFTNILISSFYGVATLGFYSLGQKILGVPTSVIGSSIGQVYFQQANAEKQETGMAIKSFVNTSKKLAVISIIFFVPTYFILPFLFEFVFGKEWRVAGEYSQIILPFVAIQFVVAAVTTTNSIFERQIVSLVWQISLLFSSCLFVYLSGGYSIEFAEMLHGFTLIVTLHYIVLWLVLKRVSMGKLF